MVVVALALVAASCSAQSATTTTAPRADFAGQVALADGRIIHAECSGEGSPTVVLISGKGNPGSDWQDVLDPADPVHTTPGDDVGAGEGSIGPSGDAVFPSVARFTRVCTYDRPDTSVPGAEASTSRQQPHTLDLDVDDLQQLLAATGEPGPYVLVAHSYGGLIAELYARTHADDVDGLVMVDAASEVIGGVISPLKLANWDETNRTTSPQVREGVEVADAFERIRAAPPMAHVPTVVLTADKPYRTDLLPPEVAQSDTLMTFDDWLASQDALARATGAVRHVTTTNSGHNIYLYSPALVTDAVREVVEAVRTPGSPDTSSAPG